MAKSEIAPHVCPQCGSPCYQGAFALECTGHECDHYHAETAAAYRREQFPSASTLLEDEPTQPQRWPSTPPAAIFPDTDTELAQQIRDGVAEALKDCTPEEAKALEAWRDEILRDYLGQFSPGASLIEVWSDPNDRTRLNVRMTWERPLPFISVSLDLEL